MKMNLRKLLALATLFIINGSDLSAQNLTGKPYDAPSMANPFIPGYFADPTIRKFGGLPGLIMKVYDTRHVYTWEAVGVENGTFPIYQPEERYYKNSTREKVWKMQGEWNRRFNELSGMLDFNFRPKTQRYPYDPLELE